MRPQARPSDVRAPAAQAVLDARSAHVGATLADLYDPFTMPADLLKAHRKLDGEVDRLFSRSNLDDVSRLSRLLERYEQTVNRP